MRRPTNMLSGALALLAVGLIASCGGSSSTQSTATQVPSGPPPVGTSIRVHAGATTLIVTPRRVIFPLRGSGATVAPGDRAAGVDLAVRNVGHGVYDSSSESDIKLRSSGGFAEPAFASSGPCATTEIDFLKEVEPGESRSGCTAFDLPKGAKPLAVRFSPEGRPAGGQTWAVKR